MAVNCYRVQISQQIVNIGVCVAIEFCFVDNAAAARHVDAVVHDDFLELLDDLGTAVAHRRCHLHTTTQTRHATRSGEDPGRNNIADIKTFFDASLVRSSNKRVTSRK
jgi:hypothetical protein